MGKSQIVHDDSLATKFATAFGSFLKVFTGDSNFQLGKLKQADVIFEGKHYQVLGKLLASGRISECYRLTLEDDAENDTELVLRRLTTDFVKKHPNCANMLEREFELHKELNLASNPHIVDIYDYIPEEKSVISKLIPGVSLEIFVHQYPDYFFKRRTTIKFCKELIKTISFLHEKGLCHFDITTDTILMKLDPSHDMVLLNIGLAAAYHDKLPLGTFADNKLPPEMQKGKTFDKQTDIYEIGKIIRYIINVRKKDPSRASNHLKMISMKCMKPNHQDRYKDVMEIYRDIEAWEHKYDNFFDGPVA